MYWNSTKMQANMIAPNTGMRSLFLINQGWTGIFFAREFYLGKWET